MQLCTNTIRYGFDNVSFRWQGLIIAMQRLDCTGTSVEGFNIEGAEPADCSRKLVFKVDNIWYKLAIQEGIANLEKLESQEITIDNLLENGNSVEELLTITDIPEFVNKDVYPAIVLDAPPDAVVMPTIKLGIKVRNIQDLYQHEEISSEYKLSDDNTDVDIIAVVPDVEEQGLGKATVTVALKTNGFWNGYVDPLQVKGKKASAVKIKTVYSVSEIGGADSAIVNHVNIFYKSGNAYVSGTTAEIMSIAHNYENNLNYARCHIVHSKLIDAKINTYVSFRDKPKRREMLNIATGNDERQEILLEDSGIDHNSLKLYFNNKLQFDYDYNTEISQLVFTAPKDAAVNVSYDYGLEKEEWLKMDEVGVQPNLQTGYYETEFAYSLPLETENKTISVIKLELSRPEGQVIDAILGEGNNRTQLYVLPHYAKKETIVCNGAFSYDEASRLLRVVGQDKEEIKISYNWMAETPKIYSLVAAWNE